MDEQVIEVLLVEDNPGDARLVIEMLREVGAGQFRLTHVGTLQAAIDRLNAEGVITDAVLLDLGLPDENGLETVRRLLPAAGAASVVVMTGVGDEQLGVAALQEGAQDYLVKGTVDGRILQRSLKYSIERQGMQTELRSMSHHDDLTGLFNRRGFLHAAQQQLKISRRHRSPFLLLFMDVDNLKQINDSYGHGEGNRALVETANVLKRAFRQNDLVGRMGGDEFAAMGVNAAEAGLPLMRDRLRAFLDEVNARPERLYVLDFSLGGLACPSGGTTSIEELLDQADSLMYEEKRQKKG